MLHKMLKHMKSRNMAMAIVLSSVMVCQSAPLASWECEDALDGVSMALQYRVDTWDMFTNVHVDPVTFTLKETAKGQGLYDMKGMMASWYSKGELAAAMPVTYNAESHTISFESGHQVLERDGIRWYLCNVADEEDTFDHIAVVLTHYRSAGCDDWVLSRRNVAAGGRYTSLGFILVSDPEPVAGTGGEVEVKTLMKLLEPSLHPYNGSMAYSFVDYMGRQHRQECVVHTWVDGRNLVVRNFSNVGFDFNLFFTIDPQTMTVTATNQVLLDDPDMLGECVVGEATADGAPVAPAGEFHTLVGRIVNEETDGRVTSTIEFPVWGAFSTYSGTNYFNPTTDTRLSVGYDILNPDTAVDSPLAGVGGGEAVIYHTMQGIAVAEPIPGVPVIERRGASVRKVIVRHPQ